MTADQTATPPVVADLSTFEGADRVYAEATGADAELVKLATMLRAESNAWCGRDAAFYRDLCRTLGYIARRLDAHRCAGHQS